jgi:small subunit ribosomal protein S1
MSSEPENVSSSSNPPETAGAQPEETAGQPAATGTPEQPPHAPAGESQSDSAAIKAASDSAPATGSPVTPSPASATPRDDESVAAEQANSLAAVRIGSQRDPANKNLSPALPKAVREAKTTPINIPVPEHLKKEAVIPGVSVDQLSSDWDADAGEFEDFNLDDLMAGNSASQAIGDEIPAETKLSGTVSRIHRDDVFFTLKGQHEGVVSLRQFKEPPALGTTLEVIVNKYNPEDSLYELTIPGAAISVSDWADIVEGSVVDAKVTAVNTGGLECMVNNIRGFIPASQAALYRIEDLNDFIDQKLQCVVTEARPEKRNLVLSHRAVLERERAEKREQLMQTLAVGSECDGTVTRLMDFGAFVELGGVEGLIHISKLAWDRVQHPKDVLEVGQKVKVKIEKIDEASGKIGLSYRDLLENPWDSVETKYPVGTIVDGTVTRLAAFGAFVKLEPGVEGLVHISELAHYRVQTVKSIVNEGDQIQVKILSVDRDAQKMSLSLKETQAKPEPKADESKAEVAESAPETPAKPRSNKPLKGGTAGDSGGEQFGLKW